MPRKRKSKDPGEGACPSCRKSVPLVPGDRGSFVLRTHHVVVADEYHSGHDVEECAGSAGEPAVLDDSEDWGWVPTPAPAGGTVSEAMPPFEDGGIGPVSLGEAIRAVTAEITSDAPRVVNDAARQLSDALTPVFTELTGSPQHVRVRPEPDGNGGSVMRGNVQPYGLQFASHVTGSALADRGALDIIIQRVAAEARTELEGRVLPEVDLTAAVAAVDVPPVPNFMGTVLAALRQAWIDVTGAPPDDATVTLSDLDFTRDMRVMEFTFQPYALHVRIPIQGNAPDQPGFAEAAGREAGEAMHALLRERLARCNATRSPLPCECNHPDREPHEHTCGVCRAHWRDPVTPTLHPDYIHGA